MYVPLKSSVSVPAFTFPPQGFHKSASGLVEILVGTFPIPSQRTGTKWKEQNWCTLQKAGRGGNYWNFCLCCESCVLWSIATSQVSWVVHFEDSFPLASLAKLERYSCRVHVLRVSDAKNSQRELADNLPWGLETATWYGLAAVRRKRREGRFTTVSRCKFL